MGSKKSPNIFSPVFKKEQRIALFYGDNAEGIKQIKDETIDLIMIDPNYGINQIPVDLDDFLETLLSKENYIRGGVGYAGAKWDAELPLLTHFEQQFRKLKPGGFVACFANSRRDHYVKLTLERAGFIIKDPIMWIRTNGTFSRGGNKQSGSPNLRVIHETIIIAQRPLAKGLNYEQNFRKYKTGYYNTNEATTIDGRAPANMFYEKSNAVLSKLKQSTASGIPIEYNQVIFCQKPQEERELGLELVNEKAKHYSAIQKGVATGANSHDTVKPIELIRKLIQLLSRENGVVLDTYMGSGTSALACLLENRRFIGMEQDKESFLISKIRTHAIYFEEVFLKEKKIKRKELQWHLSGLQEIKDIMKPLKASRTKNKIINQMIGQVVEKLKKVRRKSK